MTLIHAPDSLCAVSGMPSEQSEQIRRGDGAVGVDLGVVGHRDQLRESQAWHEEQESEQLFMVQSLMQRTEKPRR